MELLSGLVGGFFLGGGGGFFGLVGFVFFKSPRLIH